MISIKNADLCILFIYLFIYLLIYLFIYLFIANIYTGYPFEK